jgi:hypothetical protein
VPEYLKLTYRTPSEGRASAPKVIVIGQCRVAFPGSVGVAAKVAGDA